MSRVQVGSFSMEKLLKIEDVKSIRRSNEGIELLDAKMAVYRFTQGVESETYLISSGSKDSVLVRSSIQVPGNINGGSTGGAIPSVSNKTRTRNNTVLRNAFSSSQFYSGTLFATDSD
ncbi:hypothetical protein MKW98_030201 [Papaver atlanticum]|uniref:Uncharacterized protein n=1 Tax=Papaver atlanticum TaxID=357466 RepID=A0AAD4ST01_9MAGN|nr:hypothetical protein MKW98_030201 [Papaver atlanticum]